MYHKPPEIFTLDRSGQTSSQRESRGISSQLASRQILDGWRKSLKFVAEDSDKVTFAIATEASGRAPEMLQYHPFLLLSKRCGATTIGAADLLALHPDAIADDTDEPSAHLLPALRSMAPPAADD